jgi:hypothetical protein
LNLNLDTTLLSEHSLKCVLDWSWSRLLKLKIEINNTYKTLTVQANAYLTSTYSSLLSTNEFVIQSSEHLDELLARHNNMLENLVQIFKQFVKLPTINSNSAIHIELNKKLCCTQALKCFIEHLILFHKFDLILPPCVTMPANVYEDDDLNVAASISNRKNYLNEMHVNFKVIENRWTMRREQQRELLKPISTAPTSAQKYPFTYMIDCLIEECRPYALNARFLDKPTFVNAEQLNSSVRYNSYPPKSLLVSII